MLIVHRLAGRLESQLYLAVMVAFVPKHVLEQKDWVVVVKIHGASCLDSALYGVTHGFGAIVQHLRDAIRGTLHRPLDAGKVSGELRSVLEDQNQPHIMNVRKQFRNTWTAFYGPGFQAAIRESAEQVDQDGVISVPGVE